MVIVRQAAPFDLVNIAKQEQEIFTSPWSLKSLEEAYESGRFEFYIAELKDTLVAYGGLYYVGENAYVANIATVESERGKGYGRLVVSAMVEGARKHKVESISLEVRVSNSVAIRLYSSFEFRRMGIRKGFYEKPKEDALIMTYFYQEGVCFS